MIDLFQIDKVAERFAHLLTFGDPEAVRVDLMGEWAIQGHEDSGPDHRVKPEDILGDDVMIGWPVLAAIVGIDGGEVVKQGIDPDINRLLWVAGHRDAPSAGPGTRDGDIVETLIDAREDFVFTCLGLNEGRMRFDVFSQPIGVGGETEKIVLFALTHERLTIERTFVIVFLCLVFRDVFFLPGVVPAFVFALIHITALHELGDVFDDFVFMSILRGADEVIVGHAELLKGLLKSGGILIRPRLRTHAALGSSIDDFGGMLIRSGEEKDILAPQSVKSCKHIGECRGIDMADMWTIVDVVNRCRDVKCFLILRCHKSPIIPRGCESDQTAAYLSSFAFMAGAIRVSRLLSLALR